MNSQVLLSGSFNEVSTILCTIKQSREQYQPEFSNWRNYIKKFFEALGFSVQENYPRIATLSLKDEGKSPKAAVVFFQPKESFEDLLIGLSWETFMNFVTSFYHVDWGIFTDGLQLKIVQYQNQEINQRFFWKDIDQIIRQQKEEEFFAIFVALTNIKKKSEQPDFQVKKRMNEAEFKELVAKGRKSIVIREFMGELLERSKSKTPLHAKAKVGVHNNFSVSAGKRGLSYGYIILMDQGIVNLYIDNGNTEWNKAEFMRLFGHRTEIEETFGEPLEWHKLPEQKSSYIRFTVSGYNLRDGKVWTEFQDKLIDAMIRMERAFRPYILA